MANHLPQDILSKLLVKSPIKTLLICRSVCKWWKQVIDSNSFIADHLALQKPRLLATNTPFNFLVIDLQTFPDYQAFTGPINPGLGQSPLLIASVNGVICLHFQHTFLLWNPSLRRLAKLPNLPIPQDTGFDHCYSFWIDPCTFHWKIVAIDCDNHQIHLLSSTNQSWIELPGDNYYIDGPGRLDSRQVLIHGVAHWIAHIRDVLGVVAYYDFVKDEFGAIAMPLGIYHNTNVDLWKGCLSLVHWDDSKCELWTMQNGSWSKMFSAQIEWLRNVLHLDPIRRSMLAQGGIVDDVDHLLLYQHDRRVLRSDFVRSIDFSVAYEFVESLVFPDLNAISSDCIYRN